MAEFEDWEGIAAGRPLSDDHNVPTGNCRMPSTSSLTCASGDGSARPGWTNSPKRAGTVVCGIVRRARSADQGGRGTRRARRGPGRVRGRHDHVAARAGAAGRGAAGSELSSNGSNRQRAELQRKQPAASRAPTEGARAGPGRPGRPTGTRPWTCSSRAGFASERRHRRGGRPSPRVRSPPHA